MLVGKPIICLGCAQAAIQFAKGRCPKCYQRLRYSEDPARYRRYSAKSKRQNVAKRKLKNKERRTKNAAQISARQKRNYCPEVAKIKYREYRAKNLQRELERCREYRRKKPGIIAAACSRRHRKMGQAKLNLTPAQKRRDASNLRQSPGSPSR